MAETSIYDISEFTDTYVEPHAVPAGEEYQLRIISAEGGRGKDSGMPYIKVSLDIIDDDGANDFNKFLGMPHKDREPKKNNKLLKAMDDFCTAFEIDSPLTNPKFNPQDWVGATCYALLGLESSEEFGEQNFIKRIG